jgi:DNA-directed RNA polymerase II subunit RPB1
MDSLFLACRKKAIKLVPKVRTVKRIEFDIMGSEELFGYSRCELTKTATEGEKTVYDPHLGNLGVDCQTCEDRSNGSKCPGHFGHIRLNVPVIHPQFYSIVLMTLKVICFRCSSSLYTENAMKLSGLHNYKGMIKLKNLCIKIAKTSRSGRCCRKCKHLQPVYKLNDTRISASYAADKWFRLTTTQINNILKKVSDGDSKLIGFGQRNHPKNLIITILPVLPTIARPYILPDGEDRCDDDLTWKYHDIIRSNNQYYNAENEKSRQELETVLIFHISTMFDNSAGLAKQHTTKRPIGGITQRVSEGGKNNRFRRNLMGKRTDFGARSVITPDPNIPIGTIGVPLYKKFMELTIPVRCNSLNRHSIRDLMKSKPDPLFKPSIFNKKKDEIIPKIRGAITIIRGDNEPQLVDMLLRNNRNFEPKEGDIVERRLVDGDLVMFGRMPTLWKHSMMGFRIKFVPGKTFRLNPAATTPFNADFDGDECNIYVPQSLEATAEVKELSDVKKILISSQSPRPVVGVIQDTRVGTYLLTHKNVILREDDFNDAAFSGNVEGNISPTYERWMFLCKKKKLRKNEKNEKISSEFYTGRNLFSLLLPETLSYSSVTNTDPDEPEIKIKYGILLKGIICSKVIGTTPRSIVHILNEYYSDEIAVTFITRLQNMVNCWLMRRGFSVGIQDCLVEDESMIHRIIVRSEMEAAAIGESKDQFAEVKICAALDRAKDVGQKIAKTSMAVDARGRNALKDMIVSGSKGNFVNLTQIGGLLGQQNIGGQRVQKEFSISNRTLPHFRSDDTHPGSRGFITSSFISGLSPTEFWAHAISGRMGIMNTGINTSDTGYTQRKMVKFFEDLVTAYDGTVRTANKQVIQFKYGDDGFSTDKMIDVDGALQFVDVKCISKKLNAEYELEHDLAHVRR